VPRFAFFFSTFDAHLPVPTTFVISLGIWLRLHIVAATCGISLPIVAFWLLMKTKWGANAIRKAAKLIPFLRNIERKILIRRFLHQFCDLQSTGIDSSEAVLLSIQSIGPASGKKPNQKKTGRHLNAQATIATELTNLGFLPSLLIQLIAGSQNNLEMNQVLERISHFYQEEVEAAIDAYNAVIEPAIIFIAGILMTAVMVTMYVPLLSR
jgi:type IV pilus assembly protein PilC